MAERIANWVAAIAFLTRLPVGRGTFDPKLVGRSARWFPAVGGILGGIAIAALALFAPIFPAILTASLLVGMDAYLTGALHLDGLADTADGFGGGASRADVMRIMRDPVIGSFGAVALILVMALKIVGIAALIGNHRAIPALMVTPVLGRWCLVVLSATVPYARPAEEDAPPSAGTPARFIGRTELIIATVSAAAISVCAAGWHGVAALLLAGAASAFWAWRCKQRIGGVTGDTLGAGLEISECLTLLLFVALTQSGVARA